MLTQCPGDSNHIKSLNIYEQLSHLQREASTILTVAAVCYREIDRARGDKETNQLPKV